MEPAAQEDQVRTEYTRYFEEHLRQRVAEAINESGELAASSAMFELFSPSEIVTGAHVGQSLGFEPEEAVVCFVVASRSAACDKGIEHQARETHQQKANRVLLPTALLKGSKRWMTPVWIILHKSTRDRYQRNSAKHF